MSSTYDVKHSIAFGGRIYPFGGANLPVTAVIHVRGIFLRPGPNLTVWVRVGSSAGLQGRVYVVKCKISGGALGFLRVQTGVHTNLLNFALF